MKLHERISWRTRRRTRVALVHFTRQLRLFTRSGIPLARALHTIGDETDCAPLRVALIDIGDAIDNGDTLSAGCARHPTIFPPYFVGLMRSAEATGALDEALDNLTTYQMHMLDERAKVTSALMYPMIVVCLTIVTVIVLVGYVLPRFEPLFAELGSTIPLPTRILLESTSLLTSLVVVVPAGLSLAIAFGAIRSRRGRLAAQSLVLRLPLVGTIVRYVLLERFCHILAAALRSGLPLTSGMRLGSQTVSTSPCHEALVRATQDTVMGLEFTTAMTSTGLFPPAVCQMFRVGEETGGLVDQVVAAGEYLASELDVRLRRFTSLFEPTLIVVVGAIVGFVAVALVSAMYGVLDGVREI